MHTLLRLDVVHWKSYVRMNHVKKRSSLIDKYFAIELDFDRWIQLQMMWLPMVCFAHGFASFRRWTVPREDWSLLASELDEMVVLTSARQEKQK